jgi:tripartite-type tricarboxylate transporter receptor subunit TctC
MKSIKWIIRPSCRRIDGANVSHATISLIVPSSPGGTTDMTARWLSEPLARALKQSVIVDNQPPVKTLAELGSLARAHSETLTYATSGLGSIQHIGTELFLQMVNAKMLHVPYKGAGPAVVDLIAGHVATFNTTPPAVVGFIRSAKLRALAYLAKERPPAMKDIPTSAERLARL